MIKRDELNELLKMAEEAQTPEDKALAWREYAEALEERLEVPCSAVMMDRHDTEHTEDTARAYVQTDIALQRAPVESGPVQLVWSPADDLIYALEVRGQRSATAQGRQGLRASRGAMLEALNQAGVPVRLAFLDGNVWETAWLAELPPAELLSGGDAGDKDATERLGWYVGNGTEKRPPTEFQRGEELTLPTAYAPRERSQGSLV